MSVTAIYRQLSRSMSIPNKRRHLAWGNSGPLVRSRAAPAINELRYVMPIAMECYRYLVRQGFSTILRTPSQSVGFGSGHKIRHTDVHWIHWARASGGQSQSESAYGVDKCMAVPSS
jgi:hypothetical protein